MEIRGKQRGAGSKQVTLGKHPNIYFAELDKREERHFSWEQIKNHITGCRSELISNEKYRSRWTRFFYSKSLSNSFSHETCCEFGQRPQSLSSTHPSEENEGCDVDSDDSDCHVGTNCGNYQHCAWPSRSASLSVTVGLIVWGSAIAAQTSSRHSTRGLNQETQAEPVDRHWSENWAIVNWKFVTTRDSTFCLL